MRSLVRGRDGATVDPNLRTDPYDWLIDHPFLFTPAQDYVGQFLTMFKEYPQRQKAASFNLDDVLEKLKTSGNT